MEKFKHCVICGREFAWRKKWQHCWDTVKYCSKQCRSSSLTELDHKAEQVILTLLNEKKVGASICPSDAAKSLFSDDWSKHMELIRRAARRLANQDKLIITQKNQVVNPSRAKGPIRLKLK